MGWNAEGILVHFVGDQDCRCASFSEMAQKSDLSCKAKAERDRRVSERKAPTLLGSVTLCQRVPASCGSRKDFNKHVAKAFFS